MQISQGDLETLNKLQYEMHILAFQIEKQGLKESKDEYERRVKHYEQLLDYLLREQGFDSHDYGIDNKTGNVVRLRWPQ